MSSQRGVLLMTHAGDPGGAEFKMLNLCCILRQSAEVLLFQHGTLEGMLEAQQIRHHVYPLREDAISVKRESNAWRALRTLPKLFPVILEVARRGRQFDIVVCFSQKAFVLASLARPLMRRPIFWFMNDILSPAHFSRAMIRLLVILSRFSATHIAVNSRASLDAWIAAGGRRRHVSVIYPCVDSAQMAAYLTDAPRALEYRKRFSPDGRPLVGMFGRLSRWKGQDVFLRAMARLPGARGLIVGGALFSEEEYERGIRRLATELGIEDRVTFVGHVNNVMTLMAACDVVVHCSTAPEPFGLVIAEAMLAGTPVIASDAGGAREIVVPDETGLLTPLCDDEALAAAIQRYLVNPEWSRRVAEKARQRAQQEFSGTAMATQFLALLETM